MSVSSADSFIFDEAINDGAGDEIQQGLEVDNIHVDNNGNRLKIYYALTADTALEIFESSHLVRRQVCNPLSLVSLSIIYFVDQEKVECSCGFTR